MELGSQLLSGRFEVRRELGRGGMGIVYEAYDRETRTLVALKTLQRLDGDTLYRFKREFRALADLHHENLVRLGELHGDGEFWFFSMELVRGQNLLEHIRRGHEIELSDAPEAETVSRKRRVQAPGLGGEVGPSHEDLTEPLGAPFDERRLRDAFLQLSRGVQFLHDAGMVHRDIKPSNVLVTPEGRVVLLDFGLVEDIRTQQDQTSDSLVGTVAYMAPEQAQGGVIGPPADWYAVGAVLYRTLTGTVPFRGLPHLVLAEKARTRPAPPSAHVRNLPEDLDRLCHALLDPLPQLRPKGPEVISFWSGTPPSPSVHAETPAIPQSPLFIGRKGQLDQLMHALHESSEGRLVSVSIDGEAGIGKSSLVHAFMREVEYRAPRTVVLTGRCCVQESVPFKGVDGMVDELSHHLMRLDDVDAALLLPEDVHSLACLFPVLDRVPVVRRARRGSRFEGDPQLLRARAQDTLLRLLRRIGRSGPLVVAIEDLQWSDADSRALLRDLLCDEDPPPMLFLATMRTSESILSDLGLAERSEHRHFSLGELETEKAERLVEALAARYHLPPHRAPHALASGAGGHPLLLQELVRHAAVGGGGAFDLNAVMGERIAALDEAQRHLVKVVCAADVPVLESVAASVTGLTADAVRQARRSLQTEQLLRVDRTADGPVLEPYHDKIREAALASFSADPTQRAARIAKARFAIGWALLERTPDADHDRRILTIADLLSAGIDDADPEQQLPMAWAFVMAGRRAMISAVYETAERHFGHARRVLGKLQSDLADALETQLLSDESELLLLRGDVEASEARFALLVDRCPTLAERARAYTRRMRLATSIGQLDYALRLGEEALAAYGRKVEREPSILRIAFEVLRTRMALRDKQPEDFLELPLLDPREDITGLIDLYMEISVTSVNFDEKMAALYSLRVLRLVLKHGIGHQAVWAVLAYAMCLTMFFNEHDSALRYGRMACQLDEHHKATRTRAMVHLSFGVFISAFQESIDRARELVWKAQFEARDSGDPILPYLAREVWYTLSFVGGENLDTIAAAIEDGADEMERRGMVGIIEACVFHRQVIHCLQGETEGRTSLTNEAFDESRYLADGDDTWKPVKVAAYHVRKLTLYLLAGDPVEALRMRNEVQKRLPAIASNPNLIDYHLHAALLGIDLRRSTTTRLARKGRRIVRHHRRAVADLAKRSSSLVHRLSLLDAEIAALDGHDDLATRSFEDAAAEARAAGFRQDLAMTLERHARHAAASGDEERALALQAEAVAAYEAWGASQKAADLSRTPLGRGRALPSKPTDGASSRLS